MNGKDSESDCHSRHVLRMHLRKLLEKMDESRRKTLFVCVCVFWWLCGELDREKGSVPSRKSKRWKEEHRAEEFKQVKRVTARNDAFIA